MDPSPASLGESPFDRFTVRAKRVLGLAQDEAVRFNHDHIGTEHLLLGLVREGQGIAATALYSMGVQLPRARAALEFIISRGDAASAEEIALTPRAKKVLEYAVDESRRQHAHVVGTEHLLLGLIRQGDGIGVGLLVSLGIDLQRLRQVVLRATYAAALDRESRNAESDPNDIPIPPRMKPRTSKEPLVQSVHGPTTASAMRVIDLAEEEAKRLNHNYIGTEHLLLGLIHEGDGVAATVLSSMGVKLPKVRSAVEFIIGRGETTVTGQIGLTLRSKKVVELAVDESHRLSDEFIGTEHILLGLVREGEGIAAGVLESLGVNLEKIRRAVLLETMDDEQLAEYQAMVASRTEWNRLDPRLPAKINWRSVKRAIVIESESRVGQVVAEEQSDLVRLAIELNIPLNDYARAALDNASMDSASPDYDRTWSEHMLRALLDLRTGAAYRLLTELKVHPMVVPKMAQRIRETSPEPASDGWTGIDIVTRAGQERVDQTEPLGSIHILMATLREERGTSAQILATLGIDGSELLDALDLLLRLDGDADDDPSTNQTTTD